MSPRTTIFVSAASAELRGARQLVANSLQYLGYEPVWQDIFGSEQGDLRGMLRKKIDDCKGVIQLVGKRYGAEPPTPDSPWGRVSYTQYEALYARDRGKKVWYLLIEDTFATDDAPAEPQELRDLQAAYRRRIEAAKEVYYPLANQEALEINVLKMRDDLAGLRRSARRYAVAVLALLVVLCGVTAWIVRNQHAQAASTEKQGQQVTAAVEHNNSELKGISSELSRLRTTDVGKGFGNLPLNRQEELNKQVIALGVDKLLERSRKLTLPATLEPGTADLDKIIVEFKRQEFTEWPPLKTAADKAAAQMVDCTKGHTREQGAFDGQAKAMLQEFEAARQSIEKLQDTFPQNYEERTVLKAFVDDLTPRIAREETRLKGLRENIVGKRDEPVTKTTDLLLPFMQKAGLIADAILKHGQEENRRLQQALIEKIRATHGHAPREDQDQVRKVLEDATEESNRIIQYPPAMCAELQSRLEEASKPSGVGL